MSGQSHGAAVRWLGCWLVRLALAWPMLAAPSDAASDAAGNAASDAATAPAAPDPRRSGLAFMSPALQALQRDTSQNPGMLWVQDGAALWRTPPPAPALPRAGAPAPKSCADCHGDPARSLAGVAARYPAWDATSGQALNLAGRVNACRARYQHAAQPLEPDHPDLLGLTAYLGNLSRGMPLAPPGDARLAALRSQGEAWWRTRLGQLNLSCANCHDQLAGRRLAGAAIPQAHATGYPSYRLEWQGLGSLQRRLRSCVVGVRAQPWASDAPEWLALEAWLAQRAAGMPVETPAVRP